MKKLKPLKPWFIEEPTAPDDYVGHAAIRKALAPEGIKVATGEHCHNRVSSLLCGERRMLTPFADGIQATASTRSHRCLPD